jgi:hypothetical protein
MKEECSSSAFFIDAKWKCAHEKVEMEGKKTLKSSITKFLVFPQESNQKSETIIKLHRNPYH